MEMEPQQEEESTVSQHHSLHIDSSLKISTVEEKHMAKDLKTIIERVASTNITEKPKNALIKLLHSSTQNKYSLIQLKDY